MRRSGSQDQTSVRAQLSGGPQATSNGVPALVAWDVAPWDLPGGSWAASPNPTRVTIILPGIYDIIATVGWASNASGTRTVEILKNGSVILGPLVENPISGTAMTQILSSLEQLSAGDYLEVRATQTSGGALNIDQGAGRTNLFIARVAPL